MGYVVTGEYITVKTATAEGPRVVGLLKGTVLPSDVSEESIEHHLRVGLIEESDDGEAPEEPSEEAPAKSASKAAWAEYAVAQGMSAEDAEKATRDELAAKYSDS